MSDSQLPDVRVSELEKQLKDARDFMAGTSLCEGCQRKREERKIIATPRIQVEEERDRLRQALADLRALILLDDDGFFEEIGPGMGPVLERVDALLK